MNELAEKRCPKARKRSGRKAPKPVPHEPHEWVAGEYLPLGETGYFAHCPGWTEPALPESMLRPDDGAWYDKDDPDDQPSGSGVVPDKPALAPDDWPSNRMCDLDCTDFRHTFGSGRCAWASPGTPASEMPEAWPVVPAVTDDEAAIAILADNLPFWIHDRTLTWDDVALRMVQRLRSAGFLIVHPTQRGPEDPTFVMPDITAVHHTKET